MIKFVDAEPVLVDQSPPAQNCPAAFQPDQPIQHDHHLYQYNSNTSNLLRSSRINKNVNNVQKMNDIIKLNAPPDPAPDSAATTITKKQIPTYRT